MSIVTKNPPILLRSHILTISDINLPPSPINLFLIYAVCCVEIKLERTFFNLSERAFEIILVSTFNKEMSHQFSTVSRTFLLSAYICAHVFHIVLHIFYP